MKNVKDIQELKDKFYIVTSNHRKKNDVNEYKFVQNEIVYLESILKSNLPFENFHDRYYEFTFIASSSCKKEIVKLFATTIDEPDDYHIKGCIQYFSFLEEVSTGLITT